MSLGHEKLQIAKYKGPDVYVRVLNAVDAIKLSEALQKAEGSQAIYQAQLQAYVCDAEGVPTLTTPEKAQEFMLAVPGFVAVMAVKAATKLNDLSDESLEEAEKN